MRPFWLLVVIASGFGCQVPRSSIPESERVTKFVDQHGKSKDDAFTAAEKWVMLTYKANRRSIQLDDRAAGTISFKAECVAQQGIAMLGYPVDITINVKDQKSQMVFELGPIVDQFSQNYPSPDSMLKCQRDFQDIHASFAGAVTTSSDF